MTSHKEIQDAIVRVAEGDAPPGEMENVRRHVKKCASCARWQELVDSVPVRLAENARPVPGWLNEAVLGLIERGVPEDLWAVLYEVACAVARGNQVGPVPRSSGYRMRDAADLTNGSEPPSMEALVRATLGQVRQTEVRDIGRVVAASPRAGTWIGVIVSNGGVPLPGVEVRWYGGEKTATDARGAFTIECVQEAPLRVWIGVPLSIECVF